MERIKINIEYHKKQNDIFFKEKKKVKIITKGRRFGLTKGLVNYLVENLLIGNGPILWVDTTYPNIIRYYDRYIFPMIKELPKRLVKFDRSKYILRINNSVCDFRSAEREENIEGFAYKIIILNEAGIILKKRRLWENSIRPMALDYSAEMIIGGTPKGKIHNNRKHLFYELFEKAKKTKNWKAYKYSTYDNPLIKKADIKELEQEFLTNPDLVRQEIYGEFIDVGSYNIIKREWIKEFRGRSYQKEKLAGIFQSWDTAFKTKEENDFTVCTTWVVTNANYYLIDMFRERLEFPELKRKVVELYEEYKPHEIIIEDKASGQSLIQELRRETRLPIIEIKPDKDKFARVNAVSPLLKAGKVKIKENIREKEILINELIEFPNGEFDDIVDSVSQLLNHIKERIAVADQRIYHVRRRK